MILRQIEGGAGVGEAAPRPPLDLPQMGKFWRAFHLKRSKVLGNQREIAQEELKTQNFRACGGQ